MCLKKSLAPVADERSVVLVLGSMPGEDSLRFQQYYGHSRNHFWRIMTDVTGRNFNTDYEVKKRLLLESGIALWDVLESCERTGSLDTNIKNELPNNIPDFLDKYQGIRSVFFNGRKAAVSFKRFFGFDELASRSIRYFIMPSTSPANTMKYEDKLEKWNKPGERTGFF